MKRSNNLAGYIANLGKSVVYSSVDVFNQAAPSMKALKDTNNDLFKDVYHSVKDYRTTFERGLKYVKGTKLYEAADAYRSNLLEDLKTGRFYNYDRMDQIETKIVMSDVGDFTIDASDLDFDIGDFDDFDVDDINLGDKMVATTIASTSMKNASMVANSIANTGEYIVESNKVATNLLYTQSIRGFNSVNNGITNLNSTINRLLDFNTSNFQAHLDNSKKFFERTSELLETQTALLTRIADGVAPEPKKQREKQSRLRYDDVIGSNGELNIKEYFRNIKGNVNNELGTVSSMLNMFGEDSNMLMQFAASPLKFIPDFIAKKITPAQIKKSVENLDKSVSGFFSSLLTKFNTMASDNEENMIFKYIGKLFKVNNSVKRNVDTTSYEKGKVDWDGVSKKALIEVIPTQLAKIISLLSGKPEEIYDYSRGKFTTISELRSSFDNIKTSNIKSATSDMEDLFDKYMEKMQFESRQQMIDLKKQIGNAFDTMYTQGVLFDIKDKDEDAYMKYGMSKENYNIMRAMFKSSPKYMQQQINRNIMSQKEMENNYMKSLIENNPQYVNLFNNSNLGSYVNYDKKTGKYTSKKDTPIGGGLGVKDNLGHDVYYYLQNMYKELIWQRQNAGLGILGNNEPSVGIKDITLKNDSKTSDIISYRKKELNKDERFLTDQSKRLKHSRSVIDVSKLQDNSNSIYTALSNSLELDDIFDEQKRRKENPKFLEKLMQKSLPEKIGSVFELLDTATSKPIKIVDKVINRVDRRMYEIIYGQEDSDNPGLLNTMINKTKDIFFDMNMWINEKILEPIRQKFEVESVKDVGKSIIRNLFGIDVDEIKESIKEHLFGDDGIMTSIKDGIKRTFSATGNVIKNAFSSVFSPVKDFINEHKPVRNTKNKSLTLEEILEQQEEKRAEEEDNSQSIDEIVQSSANTTNKRKKLKKAKLNRLNAKQAIQEVATTELSTDETSNSIIKPRINIFSQMSSDIKIIRTILERKYNNNSKIITPDMALSPELLAHSEGSAYTDFANALSTNIANFMFGKIPKYAEGTAKVVPETQIASLTKGEVVMSVEEKKKILESMEQINAIIGTEGGIKNNKKTFSGKTNKLYTDLNSVSGLYETEFNGVNKNKFSNLLKNATPDQIQQIMGKVKGMKTNYGEVDSRGIPLNKEYAELYMQEQSLVRKSIIELGNGIKATSESLFGLGNTEQREKIQGVLNDVTSKFTTYAPEAAGGALIGAGVSLIPGIIGGPILGAAVGAGISIVKQSQKAQEWLFGEKVDGERQGGLFTKNFMKSANKYLPDIKNFGIVGGISGLLPLIPFGPVGGLIMGSVLGFAKNTDTVQKGLFGDDKLLSEKNRDKLKNVLPKMGAGALVGTLIGPFGLVGNAVVGASVGYLTTMEKFQKFVLGEKDEDGEYHNGLLPSIKKVTIDPLKKLMGNLKDGTLNFFEKTIVNPVKEALPPIRRSIELTFKKLGSNMATIFGKFLNDKLGIPLIKKIESYVFKPVAKVTGGMAKFAGMLVKGTIGLPFAAFGEVGRHIKRNQIKAGEANYMTAKERLEYRKQKRMFNVFGNPITHMDKFQTTDESLANMGDDDIEQLMSSVNMIKNTNSEIKNKRQSKLNEMGEAISNDLKLKDSKKIMKNIVKGDTEGALNYIDSMKVTDKKKSDLKAYVQNNIKQFAELDDKAKNSEATSKEYKKAFLNSELFDSKSKSFLGFNKEKMGKGDLNNLFDYIEKESKSRTEMKNSSEANKTPIDKMTDIQEKTKDLIHDQHVELMDRLEEIRDVFSESVTTRFDENGRQIKYKKDTNGTYIPDTNHRPTVLAMKEAKTEDKEQTKQTNLLDKISGSMSDNKKQEPDEEKPKKESIFGKLFNGILGIGGKLFTGLKIGGAILGGLGALGFAKEHIFPAVEGLWTNHLKPWVNDTVVPFIRDKVVPTIGGWIKSGFELIVGEIVPVLVENAVPMVVSLSKSAVSGLWNGLKNGSSKDDNKKSAESIKDKYNVSVDENGNVSMTAKDSNANYNKAENDIKSITKQNGLDKINNNGNTQMKSYTNSASGMVSSVVSSTNNDTFDTGDYKPKYLQDSNGTWFIKDDKTQTYSVLENPDSDPYLNKSPEERQRGKNLGNTLSAATRYVAGSGSRLIPTLKNKTIKQGASDTLKHGVRATKEGYMSMSGKAAAKEAARRSGNISKFSKVKNWVTSKFGKEAAEEIVESGTEGVVKGNKLWNMIKDSKLGIRSTAFKDSAVYSAKTIKSGTETAGSLLSKGRDTIGSSKMLTRVNKNLSESTLSRVMKKSGEKLIKKGEDKLAKFAVKELTDTTTKSMISKATEAFIKGLKDLFTNPSVLNLAGRENVEKIIKNAIPKIAKEVQEEAAQAVGKSMVKSGAKLAAGLSTGGILTVAFAVVDFINGYHDAANTLNIITEPTLGERVMCGTIKALSEVFFVTAIIGEKFWVNLFAKYILPIFNKSGSEELKKKQEESKKKIEDYNKKYSTNYDATEYNKEINGKDTIWGNIKTTVGDFLGFNKESKIQSSVKSQQSISKTRDRDSSSNISGSVKASTINRKNDSTRGRWRGGSNKFTSNIKTIDPFTNKTISKSLIPNVGKTVVKGVGGQKPKWIRSTESQWKGYNKGILGMGGASSGVDRYSDSSSNIKVTSQNIVDVDLRGSLGSSVTASQLDKWIESVPTTRGGKMVGMGSAFIKAGQASGLDPRYIAAHAAWETGWGQSPMVRNKNNWFGIAAYNSNPDASYSFSSSEAGIIEGAKWIASNFSNAGQPTLRSMVESKTHAYAVNDDGSVNYSWMKNIGKMIMGTPGIGPGNSSIKSGDASISSGSADTAEDSKPSVFTLFADLANGASNVLNRLYGFENTTETGEPISADGSGSIDTSSSSVSDKWFKDTLNATVTSPYSTRSNPFSGQSEMHSGIDYSSGDILGKNIKSPIAGSVSANQYEYDGFGNYLVVTDKNKNDHYFGHMKSRSNLKVGSKINVGDVVGQVGSTGSSTGPHVHYEVRNHADSSKRYDPNVYLKSLYGSNVNEGGDPKNPAPRETIEETIKKYAEMEENIKSNSSMRNRGNGDGNIYAEVLQSIVKVLLTISDNTSCLSQIVTLLTDKLGIEVSQDMKKKLKNNENSRQTIVNMIQDQVKSSGTGNISNDGLYQILQNLARE